MNDVVRTFRFAVTLAATLTLVASASLTAQRGPVKADVTPILEVAQARAGGSIHAALQVHLPEGYHTNSNKPRDPNLASLEGTLADYFGTRVRIESAGKGGRILIDYFDTATFNSILARLGLS